MDHLLHVLDRIEELLRELIVAEVRGATIELTGFDVIHNLVHVCCELVNMLSEGVGLPPFPKIIRDKVHGPFKSICRSGANPEKTLRIRGGAMQVYHHNQ